MAISVYFGISISKLLFSNPENNDSYDATVDADYTYYDYINLMLSFIKHYDVTLIPVYIKNNSKDEDISNNICNVSSRFSTEKSSDYCIPSMGLIFNDECFNDFILKWGYMRGNTYHLIHEAQAILSDKSKETHHYKIDGYNELISTLNINLQDWTVELIFNTLMQNKRFSYSTVMDFSGYIINQINALYSDEYLEIHGEKNRTYELENYLAISRSTYNDYKNKKSPIAQLHLLKAFEILSKKSVDQLLLEFLANCKKEVATDYSLPIILSYLRIFEKNILMQVNTTQNPPILCIQNEVLSEFLLKIYDILPSNYKRLTKEYAMTNEFQNKASEVIKALDKDLRNKYSKTRSLSCIPSVTSYGHYRDKEVTSRRKELCH